MCIDCRRRRQIEKKTLLRNDVRSALWLVSMNVLELSKDGELEMNDSDPVSLLLHPELSTLLDSRTDDSFAGLLRTLTITRMMSSKERGIIFTHPLTAGPYSFREYSLITMAL